MRSVVGRAFSASLLAVVLLAAGCGSNQGTGLLALSLSADPTNPPPPASKVVLTLPGGISRTYPGSFPPATGALVLEFPNLPASDSPVAITVQAFDNSGCVVGSATKSVTIKAGVTTTGDMLLAKSTAACADGGIPSGSRDGSEAGSPGEAGSPDGAGTAKDSADAPTTLDATTIDVSKEAPPSGFAEAGGGPDTPTVPADAMSADGRDASAILDVATDSPIAIGGASGSGGAGGSATSSGGVGGSGGTSAGGVTGAGGSSSGGAVGSGGTASGGSTASGGVIGSGGTATGGTSSLGGVLASGGAATGGATSSGGATGSGGSGSGGAPSSGGSGAGGSCTNACISGASQCLSSTSLETCGPAASGCTSYTTTDCSATGLVCERYAPAGCADPTWAEWPMPNSQVEVTAGAPNLENYTDNGDGTVTDNVTGLMWQQAVPTGTYTWEQAKAYCPPLTLAGHSDWRLPSRIELTSIVDLGVLSDTTINSAYFPSTPSNAFWSLSPVAGSPSSAWDSAWSVSFNIGVIYSLATASTYYVRCVR
jgi:hypothetical protein